MKKSEIPKPKYYVGEYVVCDFPATDNMPPKRDVAKVEYIKILIGKSGPPSVSFQFEGKEDWFGEDIIKRRVLT